MLLDCGYKHKYVLFENKLHLFCLILNLIIVEAHVHLPADQVSNANPQSEIISSDASSINSGTVVVEPKFEGKTR